MVEKEIKVLIRLNLYTVCKVTHNNVPQPCIPAQWRRIM